MAKRGYHPLNKDRLQNYWRFCFQKSLLFKVFWKQFSVSYFVTIPKWWYCIVVICPWFCILEVSWG